MTAFAIITGIVTILGFFLQILDVFPSQRETRKTLVVLITGVFLGSVLAVISGTELRVERLNTPFEIAVVFLLILVFLFLIIEGLRAITAKQNAQRAEALSRTGGAFFVLLVCIALTAMTFNRGCAVENITVDEAIALATRDRESGNFDRAVVLVERARLTLPKDDPRAATLEALLKDIIAAQRQSAIRSEKGKE